MTTFQYNLVLKHWSIYTTLAKMPAVADPGFSWGGGGAPAPKSANIFQFFFSENCMKMKEFGPQGGVPYTPPDPPMVSSVILWKLLKLK